MWTLGGYAANQIVRLGSNIILAKLLFPKAFGLMALVNTFVIALELFSDVGIVPSIIQNKRGDDPAFLNTAWTLQVVRGFGLWLIACLIAIPVASFYGEPMLAQLLPFVGLTTVIQGLNSTKIATANRRLELGMVTLLDFVNQMVNVVVMISGAIIAKRMGVPEDQAVWALAIGAVAGSSTRMVLSHLLLKGERNRFFWDREAFAELHRFGRWIFLSTALTFLNLQSDRLILARLIDIPFLGLYTIAQTFSRALAEAMNAVGGKVLFPSFAELVRERPERLYPVLQRARVMLISLSWCASLFFIFLGKWLIGFLYDDRYQEAGWMLQMLSIGALLGAIGNSYGNVLLAKGRSKAMSAITASQITIQLGAMILGHYLGGNRGLVIGLASVGWVVYPILAFFYARVSLWQPEVDLPFIAAASVIAAIVLFQFQVA
jgi:O-antigen/teichoic acid export membrane protein